MQRRHFLTALAAGTLGALTSCSVGDPVPLAVHSSAPPPPPKPAGVGLLPPDVASRTPLPAEPITGLPGRGRHLALTVDDGASSEVVGAYIKFAKDTGARFTFFVTGSFDSWRDNRDQLRPLVESGQIQLGNHTWTHADLTSLSSSGVADELKQCKEFLRKEFGVDGTPFYRPPYGYRNEGVDAVAADLGYLAPTLWYGSLSDSGLITEQYLLRCAREYFHPQTVIIGHANHPPVTHTYPQLVEIIKNRHLRMVTLNDYFLPHR